MRPCAALLLLLACREEEKAPRVVAPQRLQVTLPEGYVAVASRLGLEIQHQSQSVGALELKGADFFARETFEEALRSSGAVDLRIELSKLFIQSTYALSADAGTRLAFLGLKSMGGKTVACATSSVASAEELSAFSRICASVRLADED